MFFFELSRPVNYNLLLKRAKRLTGGFKITGGRNSTGHITSYKTVRREYRHVIRFIDF